MRKNFILITLLFLLINVLAGANENLPIFLFNKKREKKWGIGNLEEMSLKDYFFFFIF